MIKFTIGENEGNQRLDRFLKKYFAKAPLSYIYRLIRKDIKLNNRRAKPETMLAAGDELVIYLSEEEVYSLRKKKNVIRAKKQFSIIYEDENILIVNKPFGLLTHGNSKEKKNHLANQVVDYLISKGDYDHSSGSTFTPSPANRLDRNTTGIVLFGKKADALKELNSMLRERDGIEKFYLTITSGHIEEDLHLKDEMLKDEEKNMALIVSSVDTGKLMDTEVFPVAYRDRDGGYTLAEVKINTGRTHQIRAQLAQAGYPIIGDAKYGDYRVNNIVNQRYKLTTHLLHAGKIVFGRCREDGPLAYLSGRVFTCAPPPSFIRIKEDIFGKINLWR